MESQLILDRYRPLRELGRGGFGTVVLAWDTRMQRRVAIKRLPFPLDTAGRPQKPPGLTEARTAAMLSHPAIVTALDFDTDSDEAFIVMEHVDGVSLATALDVAGGPLDLDEAAAVVESIAAALEHAHANGVLHLDIKPENVLITRDGRIKVTDFGICALSTSFGHGTAHGGTPGYMPLEQLEGRDVSERTDEWALAALVYEMLTGENPFLEATPGAAAARLAVHEPPEPSSRLPELPGEIDDVVLTALSDRPSDRYPDVTEFADALLDILGDSDVGTASLADLVAGCLEDECEGESFPESRLGLWDRLGGRAGALLVRAAALVESAWLAWVGLTPLRLDPSPLVAAVALVAAAAALAPSLGIALGMGCLVAGLVATGSPVAAAGIFAAGVTWWWFFARHSSGASVLPLAAPALGTIRLGFAQPLLAGFALAPVPAVAAATLGGGLAMLASAATLHGPPYAAVGTLVAVDPWHASVASSALRTLLTSPSTYIAWAGWPLAAAIMSLLSARATRPGALLGAFGGTAALAGAYVLADQVAHAEWSGGSEVWVHPSLAWALAGSLILIVLVIALGAPLRPEDDERDIPTPTFEE